MLRVFFEESLSHTLVDDDECDMGKGAALRLGVVFVGQDLLELLELEINDLLAHRVANTVTIDENVVWKSPAIELFVGLKGTSEVLLKDVGRDDFLPLLSLRTGLSVVLAHVLVIGGNETNDALLALVAYIDADQHGLVGDFMAEAHAPQVPTEFGIDLADDVQVDAVVISVNSLARNELRDNRVVRVNFIFNGGVEGLLSQGVRDDDQEELDNGLLGLLFGGSWALLTATRLGLNVIPEIGIDSVLEVLDL